MSALRQKRSFDPGQINAGFAPKADIQLASNRIGRRAALTETEHVSIRVFEPRDLYSGAG